MYRTTLLLLLAALACLPVSGEDVASYEETPPILPATISDIVIPAAPVAEDVRARSWSSSLSLATVCDDNANASESHSYYDCSYVQQPGVMLQQLGGRTNWNISYIASFTEFQRLTELNETAQTLGADYNHRFTRRLSLRIREAFEDSNAALGGSDVSGSAPDFGLMQRPNSLVVTVPLPHIATTTSLETIYQLTASSFVGLTGSYSSLHYKDNASDLEGLSDTETATAGALWSHRLGRRNWTGISYQWQQISSGDYEQTTTHSLLYTHAALLGRGVAVSGFVGPQYSRDYLTATPRLAIWSPALGASIGWASDRTQIQAQAVRRIADGGGLLGASELSTVSASYANHFARHWTARLRGYYAYSGTLAMAEAIGTMSSSEGIEYQTGTGLLATFHYSRDWQHTILLNANGTLGRNRLTLTVTYVFGKTINRQ